jgi:tetratricopeptide (TPR) repeat protein
LGAWGLFQLWKGARSLAAAFGVVLLVLGLTGAGFRVVKSGQAHNTCAYDYTLNAWKALPKDALFFCEGDILQFTGWYLQFVEGKRPDLSLLGSSLSMDWNRIQLSRFHPGLKVPNPRHGPMVYDFGPLFPSMVQDNPEKRYFFSFFPQGPILKDLILSPLGLAREGAPPTRKSGWEEGANNAFWEKARLRHLQAPYASADQRTWDNLLQDYGAKRQALALYEMNLAASEPGKARDWLQKGLDQLMVVKDWNPPGSESAFEFGTFGPGLGPLLGAYVFHREVLIDIGVDYFLSGDMGQAESWIQQATQTIPQEADLYFYAGMAAVQAKNYPEARKWLQGALALDPTHAQATRLLRYVNR